MLIVHKYIVFKRFIVYNQQEIRYFYCYYFIFCIFYNTLKQQENLISLINISWTTKTPRLVRAGACHFNIRYLI